MIVMYFHLESDDCNEEKSRPGTLEFARSAPGGTPPRLFTPTVDAPLNVMYECIDDLTTITS